MIKRVVTINKAKKLLLAAVIVLVLLSVTLLVINALVKRAAKKYIVTDETVGTDYDCILILGCGVYGNRPSHMLEDRLKKGMEVYSKGASDKLLMTGDNSRVDYNEVAVMRDFAIDQDIDAEQIFMDHAGFSTYESMYRAKEIFGANKVLVVTQGYHLYRALYDARALGMDAYGVSADLRPYAGQTVRDVREVLARIKDFVWCIFKPEPTYLGEKIPISGRGNAADISEG